MKTDTAKPTRLGRSFGFGAAIIALSLFASVRHRKRHPGDYADNGVGEVILPDGDCQPDSRTR